MPPIQPAITIPPNLSVEYGIKPGEPRGRFRALRGFSLGGGVDLQPGDVVQLPRRVAAGWVKTGRLMDADSGDQPLEERDPEMESGDSPVRSRRGRAAEA